MEYRLTLICGLVIVNTYIYILYTLIAITVPFMHGHIHAHTPLESSSDYFYVSLCMWPDISVQVRRRALQKLFAQEEQQYQAELATLGKAFGKERL